MKHIAKQLISKAIRSFRREIPKVEPENIWFYLRRKAAKETAHYVENNMLTLPHFDNRLQLLEFSLSKVEKEGIYLEAGCGWQGKSINFIAKRVEKTIHGFDSFEGLPESWMGNIDKGSFALNGYFPKLENNVELHVGWFDQTVPEFADQCKEPIAFIHIDCDLYSSTKIVFDVLGNRIDSGTVIQFDEYFNYPGWKNHEYKAFQEFIEHRKLTYKYLGYCSYGYAVSAIIL